MRYLCSLIFLLVISGSVSFAQTDTLALNSGNLGQTSKMEDFLKNLPIRQDQRITDLLVRNSEINARKNGFDGFRLEIFFSSENKARELANRVKSGFNLIYPEIPCYLMYQTPNFKVRVGDFRNKSEALKTKSLIASKYPNAFIVKDMIRFPELYPELQEQTEESTEQ
jgi:hypothetical protein